MIVKNWSIEPSQLFSHFVDIWGTLSNPEEKVGKTGDSVFLSTISVLKCCPNSFTPFFQVELEGVTYMFYWKDADYSFLAASIMSLCTIGVPFEIAEKFEEAVELTNHYNKMAVDSVMGKNSLYLELVGSVDAPLSTFYRINDEVNNSICDFDKRTINSKEGINLCKFAYTHNFMHVNTCVGVNSVVVCSPSEDRIIILNGRSVPIKADRKHVISLSDYSVKILPY